MADLGLLIDQLERALRGAESALNAAGLARYAKEEVDVVAHTHHAGNEVRAALAALTALRDELHWRLS